jgi:hypothetical protein
LSAREQQRGTWTVEVSTQQQGCPPQIEAQLEHADEAWALGWTTKSTAQKQTRIRPAISGLCEPLRALLSMVPRGFWPSG